MRLGNGSLQLGKAGESLISGSSVKHSSVSGEEEMWQCEGESLGINNGAVSLF